MPQATVGGQRHEISVERLTPVPRGLDLRGSSGSQATSGDLDRPGFDDSGWHERELDLGLVDLLAATGHGSVPVTTYFRHAFDVEDPRFIRNLRWGIKRSDGAVAYLNGKRCTAPTCPMGPSARTLARAPATGLEGKRVLPRQKLDPALLRRGRNVLAVEIHRAAKNVGAPTFDLELSANWESPQLAPEVQFASVSDGTLLTVGRKATIAVDTLDPDGSVRSVTFLVDGKPVQTSDRAPFKLDWPVEPGPHRLTAAVTDNDGLESKAHSR
jgi:hypothetical protein